MTEPVPDYGIDEVETIVHSAGVVLTMKQVTAVGAAPAPVVRVRVSHELAKVLAILLRKQLRQHEDSLGQHIPVHPQVAQAIGISVAEDWP